MQGRRRPDVRFGELPDDLQPGDYWRYTVGEGDALRPASAKALYGSSNSVLHTGGPEGKTWHGYVDHGVWEAC